MAVYPLQHRSTWTDHRKEFLQQWAYGDFLRNAGRQVHRVCVERGDSKAFVQYLSYTLPLGVRHVYLPRVDLSQGIAQELFAYFSDQGVAFARLDPTLMFSQKDVADFNTRRAPSRQVQHTWVLDIEPDDDALFEAMHHKTRYNIRLARKRGVEIRSEKDLDIFWKLREVTLERNEFASHPKSYYEYMYALDNVHQLTAYYAGKPIAVVLQLHVGDILVYVHGASANEHRNVMAPYLLQWESIQLAKRLGCSTYDFWGTAKPVKEDETGTQVSWHHGFYWDANHPWSGVARFKAGFGGEVKTYPEAVDIIFSPVKYHAYKLMSRFVRSI